MKPTKQQQDIIKEFRTTDVLKVNAVAGSGKSSTLAFLAVANPEKSLYMAFNKAIAEEARRKFPDHVECRTTHSLAFAEFGRPIMHKLNRPKGGYVNVAGTSSETAQFYQMSSMTGSDPETDVITATSFASLVRNTVKHYEQSSSSTINKNHVPHKQLKELVEDKEGFIKGDIVKAAVKYAKKLWADRIDQFSEVLATHDTYLKLWQLSKPKLHYKIIYLDEAQDTNPVVLDVVKNQSCQVVYVGDTHQSIYQFRGAINAMETINAPAMELTMSFRYGEDIAKVAKHVIMEQMDVQGNPKIGSKVGRVDTDKQYTILFRTNTHLFHTAVDLARESKKVKCEVDVQGFLKLLDSAENLYRGNTKQVKHEEITPFSTWNDLLKAAEEDAELKRVAKIVEGNMTTMFKTNLNKLEKNPSKADIILTTAHKSKGREFEQVVIADDFPELSNLWHNETWQELNLIYVAVTRAIKVLELPLTMANDLEWRAYDERNKEA